MDRFIPNRHIFTPVEKAISIVPPAFKCESVPRTQKHRMQMTRILDAPNLYNWQFSNLIDWSMGDTLAIALDRTIYLYDYVTRNISTLSLELESEINNNNHSIYYIQFNNVYYDKLAIISEGKEFAVADIHTGKPVYIPPYVPKKNQLDYAHLTEWNKCNPHLLYFNYPTGSVTTFDIRTKGKCQEINIGPVELTRIKCSHFDENVMITSNVIEELNLIDLRLGTIKYMDTIRKDSRVLEWSPCERNVFFCGKIPTSMYVFDLSNTPPLEVEIGSRVTSILFSKTSQELVCGTSSQERGTIKRYNYKTLNMNSEESPRDRCTILNMCSNPQGTLQAFATNIETIEVWEMFEPRTPERSVLKRQHGKFNPIEIR